jgi:hypothetical protein
MVSCNGVTQCIFVVLRSEETRARPTKVGHLCDETALPHDLDKSNKNTEGARGGSCNLLLQRGQRSKPDA